MKVIYTRKGQAIIVDDEDYESLNKHKWHIFKGGSTYYAARKAPIEGGKQATARMHRVIMEAKQGVEVDHINGDGLDNRKANLRLCTKAQNAMNQGPQKSNTSGYKGVCWHKGKWMAQIQIDGKKPYLGRYNLKEDAARAYDKAAVQHFGDFARLNFPREST